LKLRRRFLAVVIISCASLITYGQVTVKGTVYDRTRTTPLEAVSVLSTSGAGTSTDINGRYSITVHEGDSIWFSYLNKPTPKFAVLQIPNLTQFDISVHVASTVLREVKVMSPSYRQDSIQNRKDYAKVFNFRKPGIGIATSPPGSGGAGVGLDLEELINVFRFKRTRSMLGFQKRLLQEEQDKFIDHRFSKSKVREITLLTGEQLDRFMKLYRPDYEFTANATDYEFYDYIKKAYLNYRAINTGM
jgi:hypothetical protein